MVTNLYDSYFKDALSKNISWPDDTVVCLLCGEGYTPSPSHSRVSELTSLLAVPGHEDGVVITGKAISVVGGVTKLTADNIRVDGVTITGARYAVLAVKKATAAESVLLGYLDFEVVKGVTNGEFAIEWPSGAVISHSKVS